MTKYLDFFSKYKKRLKGSQLFRNTLLLTVATIFTQLITIGISPILTRIYSPEDYGVLGKITAFTTIFVAISTLKYDMAIVVSKSPKETKQLLCWSEFSILLTATIAVIIYSLIYSFSSWLILISVFLIVFLNGNFYLFTNLHTRYKNFKKLAIARIINRTTSGTFQILFGLIKSNVYGLIFGLVLGLLAFFTYLSRKISLSNFIKIFKFNSNSFKESLPVLKKHYRFPLYTTPQVLLNSLSQSAPLLMMDSFFGSSIIGFYWLAYRILKLPIDSISNSIRVTFYQKSSALKTDKELFMFLIRSTAILFLMGLPFLVLGFFVLPFVFEFAFGQEWALAGEIAKWLSPWMFLLFINTPAISMVPVIKLQKFNLIFDVILVLSRISVVYIGGTYFDALTTIKMFSLVGVLFNVSMISLIIFIMWRRKGLINTIN